jgi:DNA repair protein RadA/Sms
VRPARSAITPQELSRVTASATARIPLSIAEFNRVLGGGLVKGSLVLIGGEPGIGKSTLLLEVAGAMAASGGNVVYVSGEESVHQVKVRAERLGVAGDRLFLLPETDLPSVLAQLDRLSPALVVVDSIQTMRLEDVNGSAGSVSQIRECTLELMRWAKRADIPVIITGHVTKDGTIAGPKALEHIVDVVLQLEGEQFNTFRVLHGIKNRFGSTHEIAVFEMTGGGLKEVPNPSQVFLSGSLAPAAGSVVVPVLEGTRPLLVEVQALTSVSAYAPPRRMANGVDFNRLLLISAVLSKRAGLKLTTQDIIVNVVGGIKIEEPAADLAVALAIASSYHDRPAHPSLIALGEISLSGELRPVPQLERRVIEADRLGFRKCLVPRMTTRPPFRGIKTEILEARDLREALRLGLASKVPTREDDDLFDA